MEIPEGIEAVLPDAWFVRRVDGSTNPLAWWIAANPRRGEGKLFRKEEWQKAVEFATQRAKEQGLAVPTTKS